LKLGRQKYELASTCTRELTHSIGFRIPRGSFRTPKKAFPITCRKTKTNG